MKAVDWRAIRDLITYLLGTDEGADMFAVELERQGIKAEPFDEDGNEIPESQIDTSAEDAFDKEFQRRLTLAFGAPKRQTRRKSK